MTETTDIAALRSLCKSAADCGYVHPVSVDGRLLESLLSQLGSERQRADNWSVSFENERLRADKLAAHIEALKGDQVPMFEIEMSCGHWLNMGPVKGADLRKIPDGIHKLFTAPQKPVVLPQRYTSASLAGQGITVKDTDGDLLDRLQVIAAIEAAGGVVQAGDVSDKSV